MQRNVIERSKFENLFATYLINFNHNVTKERKKENGKLHFQHTFQIGNLFVYCQQNILIKKRSNVVFLLRCTFTGDCRFELGNRIRYFS